MSKTKIGSQQILAAMQALQDATTGTIKDGGRICLCLENDRAWIELGCGEIYAILPQGLQEKSLYEQFEKAVSIVSVSGWND